jgi:hypothetical protein
MAFDPSIILGYRGVEIPNQLAQYAQMAQVENAQQQNALAQFQLGAARRAEQGQNALGQAYGAYYGGGGNMGGGAAASPAGETLAGMGAARGGINYADMRQAIVDKLRTTAPNLIPAELARINEMEQKGLLARKTQTDIDTANLTQQKSRQDFHNFHSLRSPLCYRILFVEVIFKNKSESGREFRRKSCKPRLQ